jgi:hypothetical protein
MPTTNCPNHTYQPTALANESGSSLQRESERDGTPRNTHPLYGIIRLAGRTDQPSCSEMSIPVE